MAVLETPWFMKSKTSDLSTVNQLFEERFQRQVSVIEEKQKKSLMKIDDEMKMLRRDFQRIRTEVDFSTDLDEDGKKIDPEARKNKSAGDLKLGNSDEKIRIVPRTRTAMVRHRKFTHALYLSRRKRPEFSITEMIKRDKYSQENELKYLEAQLKEKVHTQLPRKLKHKKSKLKKRTVTEITTLSTIVGSDKIELEDIHATETDLNDTNGHLPTIHDSSKERPFSISSIRKRSYEQLPSINGIDNKITKAEIKISYEI